MCDPVTALGVGTAGLQLIGANDAVDKQNQQAEVTKQNAITSANEEYATTTQGYIEQSRSLIQSGFDAVLEGRANEALAYTSAIENGVQGNSVKALMRDRKQTTDRSLSRTTQELESLETQTGNNLAHISSKANARVASTPRTSLNIGDAASILTPIVKSQLE